MRTILNKGLTAILGEGQEGSWPGWALGEAVAVPPPRSKPRKSPAALPSLTCAPDTSFDLFAWPGEAPARDEDALAERLVAL